MKQIKRIIPAVMASQHPDHASKPYWHDDPFISTQEETEECFRLKKHKQCRQLQKEKPLWPDNRLISSAP